MQQETLPLEDAVTGKAELGDEEILLRLNKRRGEIQWMLKGGIEKPDSIELYGDRNSRADSKARVEEDRRLQGASQLFLDNQHNPPPVR